MNKNIAFFLVLTVLLVFSSPLSAQRNDIFSQLRSSKTLANHGLFSARLIMQYRDDLELNDRQVDKIENVILSYEETSIRMGAEIKIFELKLTKQIKEINVNKEEIEKNIREISQLKTDGIIAYVNHLFQLKKILSQKKIRQLKTIVSKRAGSKKRRFNSNHYQ